MVRTAFLLLLGVMLVSGCSHGSKTDSEVAVNEATESEYTEVEEAPAPVVKESRKVQKKSVKKVKQKNKVKNKKS